MHRAFRLLAKKYHPDKVITPVQDDGRPAHWSLPVLPTSSQDASESAAKAFASISKAKNLLDVFYSVGPRRVLAAPVFIEVREYLFGDSNDCSLVSVNRALKDLNIEPISRQTAHAMVTAFQVATRHPNPGQHWICKPGEPGADLRHKFCPN